MTALIVTIHVVVSIALILIILLQTGKGADMGAVFGGAGSQALFGNTGAATFLGKMTTVAAVVFMITSLTLAYISKGGGQSVVSGVKPVTQQTQPMTPPTQPAPVNQTATDQNDVPTAQKPATATQSPADSHKAPVPASETSPASKSHGSQATPTPEQ